MSHDKFYLQAYFLCLHIAQSYVTDRPVYRGIIVITLGYIAIYTLELIFTIQIYDDVKSIADSTGCILNQLEYSSRLHDFNVRLGKLDRL